jgi:hypothetical protein
VRFSEAKTPYFRSKLAGEELTLLFINFLVSRSCACMTGTHLNTLAPSPGKIPEQGAHSLAKLFSENKICPALLVVASQEASGANYFAVRPVFAI